MRPKHYTVPQMIDLIIRLLIEKMYDTKRDEVQSAVITLKELKAKLDPEYLDHKMYGKMEEE